jgi:Baseplate J-like protein
MMAKSAPKIDERTAAKIAENVRTQLAIYLPQEFPESLPLKGFNLALVNIFARYCEIIIQRLNQVPQKNFLAFLDLLGAAPLPPQPSRVPLTFSLAAGSTVDAIVPAGTQVAAPPPPGEEDPVIFETERELVVTAVELAHIFVRDPRTDCFTDLSQLTRQDAPQSVAAFEGKDSIEHILYIGEDTVLGDANLGTLTLKFELISSPVSTSGEIDPRSLEWEIWDGDRGIKLPLLAAEIGLPNKPQITSDTTNSLSQNGEITFENLPLFSLQTVANISSHWLRCRLTTRITKAEKFQSDMVRESQLPKIVKVTFQTNLATSLQPNGLVSYNDFNYQSIDIGTEFKPFIAINNSLPTLYFGFQLPERRQGFPNRSLSLYFNLEQSIYNPQPSANVSAIGLIWEYWNPNTLNWQTLRLEDDTKAFTSPSFVEFLPPATFGAKLDFNLNQPNYWLRAYWRLEPNQKSLPLSPQLAGVLLNTIIAIQSISIRDEILGSSDGSENQTFNTTKTPILLQQRLEVRELEEPIGADRIAIDREEGQDAIAITRNPIGNPQEIWVRWHEVVDFYGSSSRDRHYVLDHLTGEIRFGNGSYGKIPPIGTGNLRMNFYHTGGGIRGNSSVGSIVQLKTTIPYVDRVTNPVAAAGGSDAEKIESLLGRAPRKIRHGDRSVTIEDYEDLAIEASPTVARAKCFPLLNLAKNPFDATLNPGTVSIIIVPRSSDPKPLPSLELIDRVQSYLADRSIPTVTIAVVGPLYIRFNVTAEIATVSLQGISTIEQNIRSTLDRFLHPLTGGSDKRGWTFGRIPHDSDFYALLESIPGVDHIRSLSLASVEDFPEQTQGTKRFLVYSGTHDIQFV